MEIEPCHIYTDGGCLPNRLGSWAFVILGSKLGTHEVIHEHSGIARATTSTRMELQASVQALKALPEGIPAILWTDSRVVLEIVQKKMTEWKNNGWLRSRGQQVIDLDLIQELDAALESKKIEWRWVRAHSGNKYNDYCDELCRAHLRTGVSRIAAKHFPALS